VRGSEPAPRGRRIKNETSQTRLSRGTPVEQPLPRSLLKNILAASLSHGNGSNGLCGKPKFNPPNPYPENGNAFEASTGKGRSSSWRLREAATAWCADSRFAYAELLHKFPMIAGHNQCCLVRRIRAESCVDTRISGLHLLRIGPCRHIGNLVVVADIDRLSPCPIRARR
jgi:hypothetical protein